MVGVFKMTGQVKPASGMEVWKGEGEKMGLKRRPELSKKCGEQRFLSRGAEGKYEMRISKFETNSKQKISHGLHGIRWRC